MVLNSGVTCSDLHFKSIFLASAQKTDCKRVETDQLGGCCTSACERSGGMDWDQR